MPSLPDTVALPAVRVTPARTSPRIPASECIRALGTGVVAVFLVIGCESRIDAPPQVRPLACPAPPASAEPHLSVAGDRLYLSWLTHLESGHVFQYAVHRGGRWSEPRTVAAGDSFFANWADFPALVELADGSLVAHWLWRSGADTYAYDVLLARSTDGIHWSRGTRPHRDGTQTEHGFVSLAPDEQSGATGGWLDGRDYAVKSPDTGEMHLMGATLTADGCSVERLVDTRVCDCCQTAAVPVPGGVLAAYRDRSSDEVRDISLVRFANGAWSEPYPLAADGWRIAGCPVNGPSLAADGERVAAAWFTMGDEQQPAVRVALSRDAGKTFPILQRADDGDPLGRADVAMLPGGGALVLWVESAATGAAGTEGAASIRARRVHDDGSLEPSFPVAATTADRASGFPRLERLGQTLYCAWTEAGAGSQVRMAMLELPSSWSGR